jgi:hypothetical protein
MECSEVRALLSEAALGDLDAGPARQVADHMGGCEPCRAAQASTASTLAALRSVSEVAPSAQRRDAVVRAMSRVRGSGESRRTWFRWVAASAVFVLAIGAVLAVRSERGFDFRVASVSGRVELLERSTGLWRAVSVGDVARPGDRLVTQIGGIARLDLGAGTLHVGPESSLDFVSGRRIVLDRGQASVELHGMRDLVISDTANNTLTLRAGRVDVGLCEAKGSPMVGGSIEKKGEPSFIPAPHMEAARRLVARVMEGEADLDGSLRQRLHVIAGQEGKFNFGGQPSMVEPERK